MSKFNRQISNTRKTTNLAGGDAFVQDPKVEFVSILLTSFVKDQFYKSESEGLDRVVQLVDSLDKLFVAKAAVYARNEFGMRSISHVVAGEVAKRVKGEQWTKRFYDKVVHRPDDITEILSYYYSKYGKPYPNSLKKGLALAFNKFDAYQLAKHRGEGKDISLVDAINYVHPKPSEAVAVALKKLVEGELRSENTWETKISAAGKSENKEEAKKEAWSQLVKEGKIGYFALLRNLRNILEQAPEVLDEALKLLEDEGRIRKSLVLPFRFMTALEEIKKTNLDSAGLVMVSLNKAVETSLKNVPKLNGRTLVVLDNSGSMDGKPAEIGSLFASILVKSNGAEFMVFSDDARYVTVNPADSVITIAEQMRRSMTPSGTNFNAVFQEANKAYERIIILSDMQGWMGNGNWGYGAPSVTFKEYKTRTGADPIIYSFDLQGYGSLQFPERNVYELAGFSDKVFDIMKLLETDRNALVHKIEEVEI